MFKPNDHVISSATGVCRITGVKAQRIGGSEEQEYYVLRPVYNSSSTTYVSTSNEELLSKMRLVMTKDEAYDLIRYMPGEEMAWIDNERERSQAYYAKLVTVDGHELLKLIRTLYGENQRKKEAGKHLGTGDMKIMVTAEKLLHEEMAFVFGINREEVVSFLQQRIS